MCHIDKHKFVWFTVMLFPKLFAMFMRCTRVLLWNRHGAHDCLYLSHIIWCMTVKFRYYAKIRASNVLTSLNRHIRFKMDNLFLWHSEIRSEPFFDRCARVEFNLCWIWLVFFILKTSQNVDLQDREHVIASQALKMCHIKPGLT